MEWVVVRPLDLPNLTSGTLIRLCWAGSEIVEVNTDEEYQKLPQCIHDSPTVWTMTCHDNRIEIPNGKLGQAEICLLLSCEKKENGKWEIIIYMSKENEVITFCTKEWLKHWKMGYDPNDLNNWSPAEPFLQVLMGN
jgi:hypothetical protein